MCVNGVGSDVMFVWCRFRCDACSGIGSDVMFVWCRFICDV